MKLCNTVATTITHVSLYSVLATSLLIIPSLAWGQVESITAGLAPHAQSHLSQSEWGLTAQASTLIEAGKYQQAIALLRQVGQTDPKHLLAHYLWAEAAYHQAQQTLNSEAKQALLDEARETYEKTVLLNPRILSATLRLGKLAMDDGDLKAAERYYSHALEVLPESAILQFNLANAYDEQGLIRKAKIHYQLAISLSPGFTYAYNNLGLLYENENQLDKAAEAFNGALKADDTYNFARLNLGQLLLKQEKFDEALATFKTALTYEPDNAWAYIYMGNLHVQQRQYPQAEQAYRTAIQHEPNYAPTYYLLAAVLQKQEQWSASLQYGEAYLNLSPNGQFAPQAKQLVAYVRQQQTQPLARGYVSAP